ncbi:hypothetical protein [Ensifer aridi]|uniref:hypothetical protein n=1 Tax=Ensifer aridi TaxID=1708715 RepID=UPI001FCE057C|nr:hypothetical protein [Ensifer aridi]
MAKVQYEIVEHDGGWAYRVDDVFSETFPTHDDALAAAEIAANQHEVPGSTENIEFQDSAGRWHEQVASGFDRPRTEVVDTPDIRHTAERRIPEHRNAFGAVMSSLVLPSRSATFVVLPAVGNSRALTYRAHRRAYGQARQRFEGAGLKCDTAALPVPQSVRM